MRKLIAILLFILPLPILAYHNPGNPTGFVNDFANVIDEAQESQIESKLVQFEKETSNEISVVTVNNLGEDYIENFAVELFSEWGIGKKDKDNGVLVLVAIEDRKMRIEVGYGLEGALTDAQSNWIINNQMKPEFKKENYGIGIDLAVDNIINATKGEYVPSSSAKSADTVDEGGWNWEFIIWIVIVGFMWLAAILGRSKSWWAGGVIGGVVGVVIGFIWGFLWLGIGSIVGLTIFGLIFDYIVSKQYKAAKTSGGHIPWWIGGGRGGSSGGGFGGFGGGFSGGGGSSGSW